MNKVNASDLERGSPSPDAKSKKLSQVHSDNKNGPEEAKLKKSKTTLAGVKTKISGGHDIVKSGNSPLIKEDKDKF